jgi:uncharacterized protein DUF1579
MNNFTRISLLMTVVSLIVISPVIAPAQERVNDPDRIFRDELLDNLTGEWKLIRKIRGRLVENSVNVDWVLNHQFLRIHMRDVAAPPAYEAMVFIGYDNVDKRYVVHWLDAFGGGFSQTLGYGSRSGNSMKLLFAYPDGPFVNTLTWNPETKTWHFLMQQKQPDGKWTIFAEDDLSRVSSKKQ